MVISLNRRAKVEGKSQYDRKNVCLIGR